MQEDVCGQLMRFQEVCILSTAFFDSPQHNSHGVLTYICFGWQPKGCKAYIYHNNELIQHSGCTTSTVMIKAKALTWSYALPPPENSVVYVYYMYLQYDMYTTVYHIVVHIVLYVLLYALIILYAYCMSEYMYIGVYVCVQRVL